jgi:predicted DNA-binding transcriptional regulator AlpA
MEILRLPDVMKLTKLSQGTIWRMEQKGLFPQRRQIAPGCVGWTSDEIQKWIHERPITTLGQQRMKDLSL